MQALHKGQARIFELWSQFTFPGSACSSLAGLMFHPVPVYVGLRYVVQPPPRLLRLVHQLDLDARHLRRRRSR